MDIQELKSALRTSPGTSYHKTKSASRSLTSESVCERV